MSVVALSVAACGGGGGSGSTQTPPPPPTQYTIGGSVTGLSGTGLVLQDNGGDNLAVSASGPFTFATKLNSGATYSVTVGTQPTGQTCTVASGSGTASANVTNVAVSCTNTTSNVTIGGTVQGLTGTGLVLQDNGGDSLPVTQNGTFTFATALAAGTAYAVTVSTQPSAPAQTCTVTSGTGTTASSNVTNVVVNCATVGKFAYTANYGDGTISAYTIDPTSGALNPVAGGPFGDGTHPAAVSLAPNGKFAFSASDNGTKINAFTIDQTSGKLTPVPGSPFTVVGFTTGSTFPDIAVDAQSAHLYLASYGDGEVAGFAIDPNTGALTPLAGSPYTAAGGAGAIPAFSPDGKYLYVMDQTANEVSGYSIDPTSGALTPLPGGPVATGTDPTWIVFTPDGKYAYVANTGDLTISAYSVSSGVLTPFAAPNATFATDEHPQDLTIDASGTHLYAPVANGSTPGAVDAFTINADGTLANKTSVPAGVTPIYLAIDPAAPYAYVASKAGAEVYGYSIDPTSGALTALPNSPFSTGAGSTPQFITIDASGKFGYTSNEGTANISGFAIDPATGTLNPIAGSPFAAGLKPIFVSISPEAPGIRD
jgi:6-phosphogluconolactonase (cycloisomerase 2 family)